MFEIRRYTPDNTDEWNQFVAQSKNGTFLFDRGYMDYHSDRFADYSLMFYDDKGLFALLPANACDHVLYSHQGLTYGGLITDGRATAVAVSTLFQELNQYLRQDGFLRVEYKPVPWIYHSLPSEEDLYALFIVCRARLIGRDISSAISPAHVLRWRRDRRYNANKAFSNGVIVEKSEDYPVFWQILASNLLSKYDIRPVHSLDEIMLLKSRFPEQIALYVAKLGSQVLGGTVMYHCGNTDHSQYISATPEGKRLHAVDALCEHVIGSACSRHRYFDFGKSTLGYSYDLNSSLIFQKEGFGGRAVCYDTYEWTL